LNITIDLGFLLRIATSFGECLFLQTVIRMITKGGPHADLHREKT